MTKMYNFTIGALSLGIFLNLAVSSYASAQNILQDGNFQNAIGTGGSLTPWSDWTNAGVTRSAAPTGIPGNYASLPLGADLFQDFGALANGNYYISFYVNNVSSWSAQLVYAVQQAIGTPVSELISLGFLVDLSLQANSGWMLETLNFTVDNPGFSVNEFTFSNSYDGVVPGISNSNNPNGTTIEVADVVVAPGSAPINIPEPADWLMMLSGILGLVIARKVQRV